MNKSRRRQINKALAALADAIDTLGQIRAQDEKELDNLPEPLSDGGRAMYVDRVLGHLEDAIADLVNVEDWLEANKAWVCAKAPCSISCRRKTPRKPEG
jgi:hypothetical protein